MPRWTLIDEFLGCARANDVEGLKRLFEMHPVLINALDRRGWNALASAGGAEAIAWLLETRCHQPARS